MKLLPQAEQCLLYLMLQTRLLFHFLEGRTGFNGIPEIVEKTMRLHNSVQSPELDDIFQADSWARQIAGEQLTD